MGETGLWTPARGGPEDIRARVRTGRVPCLSGNSGRRKASSEVIGALSILSPAQGRAATKHARERPQMRRRAALSSARESRREGRRVPSAA